eukprot:gene4523-20775_t
MAVKTARSIVLRKINCAPLREPFLLRDKTLLLHDKELDVNPFIMEPVDSDIEDANQPFNLLKEDEDEDDWSVGEGGAPEGANVTMELKTEDFIKMFNGELNPAQAFMGGKLKIGGDMMMAMKLEKLMKKFKSKL